MHRVSHGQEKAQTGPRVSNPGSACIVYQTPRLHETMVIFPTGKR